MNQLLQPGENIKLNDFSGTVIISHSIDQRFDIHLVCFLIDESGKTRDIQSVIYINQPNHPSGAIVFIPFYELSGTKTHSIDFDLRKAPAYIKKLIFTLADNNHVGLSELKNLQAEVRVGSDIISLNQGTLATENGIIVLELYILREQAKLRSVWQGFSSGLEGLCQHYGSKLIEIETLSKSHIDILDEEYLLNPHYVMRYSDYDRELYGKNLTAILVTSCQPISDHQSRFLRLLLKSMSLDDRMVEFIENSRYINKESLSEFFDFIIKKDLAGCFMVDELVLLKIEKYLTEDQHQIVNTLAEKTRIPHTKLKQSLELVDMILNKNDCHDKINFDRSFFNINAWGYFINEEKIKNEKHIELKDEEIEEFLTEEKIKDLKKILKNKVIPFLIQEKLFKCEIEQARVILAENESTSEEILVHFAKKGTPTIRESLAENPVINTETQRYLLETGGDDIKNALARNIRLLDAIQIELARDSNWRTRWHLAKNQNICDRVQEILASDDDVDVRAALAENDLLLEKYINLWICDEDYKVRSGLAKNRNLNKNQILVLADDLRQEVQKSLAGNPVLTDSLQSHLLRKRVDDIDVELARNKSLAVALQAELAQYNNTDVLIALFNNQSLDKGVRKTILQKCNREELKVLEKRLTIKEEELRRITLRSIKAQDAAMNAMFGTSLFNSDAKIDRLNAEYDRLSEEQDRLFGEVGMLENKIEKYVEILKISENNSH